MSSDQDPAKLIEASFEKINEKFDKLRQELISKNQPQNIDSLVAANNALREVNARLIQRLSDLEKLFKKNIGPDICYPETEPSPTPSYICSAASTNNHPGRKKFDVLLLSDSIFRHVGGACPKPRTTQGKRVREPAIIQEVDLVEGVRALKVVVPGAQCARLLAQAAHLEQSCTFDHVIVNVGTNYCYSDLSAYDIADEIEDFLGEIGALFDCKVSYSEILPRILDDLDQLWTFQNIRFLNSLIGKACQANKFARLCHPKFRWNSEGRFNRRLLARDGCHLSYDGVEAMEDEVRDHIILFSHTNECRYTA